MGCWGSTISTRGRQMLWRVEDIVRLLHRSPRSLTFTLFDSFYYKNGYIVVQVAISRPVNNRVEYGSAVGHREADQRTPGIQGQAVEDCLVGMSILRWDYDHIFYRLFNFLHLVLRLGHGAASVGPNLTHLRYHYSVGNRSLSVCNEFVSRSHLEYIRIACTSF